jgi:hypothetical protein
MKDKKHLRELILNASEAQVQLVLFILLVRRAWRAIPHLRPQHLIIPATLLQIIVFIIAACFSQHFISTVAIGNIIVVGIALLPMTFPQPLKAHWVKACE